ncbi:Endonuclease/exonuclease/phosphatase [Trema orientale]|uniref:Endonuclease/exonuclease/phosphatase n=1 Tax=Trema orientale TaxID=63057 RepID=A0A2P5EJB7_TREOI|nr:Endonuclease/exonuclease/phosphatase [Trema orientale]
MQDYETWSSIRGLGGSTSSSGVIRACLHELGMVDLGFSSPQFTWKRRRRGVIYSRARLDRAVATGDWAVMFPRADHCPMVLNTHGDMLDGVRTFRFEAMWIRDIRSH